MLELLRSIPSGSPLTTSVTSVSPTLGEATDTLRIFATRVSAGATATVGGNAATVTDSLTGLNGWVDVTLPAHADGAVDVVLNDVHGSSTSTGAFTYQDGGPPATDVLFNSAWPDTTGAGLTALTDGGKWDNAEINNNITVIAATGLGFPTGMTNVLRFLQDQPNPTACAVQVGPVGGIGDGPAQWDVPGAGESLFFRFYFRWSALYSPEPTNWCHPWETNLGEPTALHVNWRSLSDTTWAFAWRLGTTDVPAPNGIWTYGGTRNAPGALSKDTVYRCECHIARLSTSGGTNGTGTFNFHARLFTVSGATETQVADDSDFHAQFGSTVLSSNPTLAWPSTFNLNGIIWDSSSGSGSGWSPASATEYNYGGGMMVRSDDWCGPFDPAEEG